MSGTLTGTRLYALMEDCRESGDVVILDSPNFGVCFKARRDRTGDTRREFSVICSSRVSSVGCVGFGCSRTDMDRYHASTLRSLVR